MIKQTIFILLAAFGLLASDNSAQEWSAAGIILSDGLTVTRYSKPDTASISTESLSSGDQVTILDSTRQVFNIGIWKETCPVRLVKVRDQKGKVSWVSGQFVFQIGKKKIDMASADFSIGATIYKIYSGRNFVAVPVNKTGQSKCTQCYPLLLYDEANNKYSPVLATDNPVLKRKKMTNPHSTYKYSSLVDDKDLQEKFTNIINIRGVISLGIEGKYQKGSCTYLLEISYNLNNEFISRVTNYKHDNGTVLGDERPQY